MPVSLSRRARKSERRRGWIFLLVVIFTVGLTGCFALFSLDDYGPPSDAPDAAPVADSGFDADAAEGDAPIDSAPLVDGGKIVFVTEADFQIADKFRTIDATNSLCAQAAAAAGLTGTFAVWLSNGKNTPASSFALMQNHAPSVPLVTPTRQLIANDYAELIAKGPRIAIAVTETKKTLPDSPSAEPSGQCVPTNVVWTGTAPNGTKDNTQPALQPTCQDWQASNAANTARAGRITKHPTEWTSACYLPCNERAHLYCFEQ